MACWIILIIDWLMIATEQLSWVLGSFGYLNAYLFGGFLNVFKVCTLDSGMAAI